MRKRALLLAAAVSLAAQDLSAILARLEKLEAENRELRGEVKQLRDIVEGAKPTVAERLAIVERRVEEQASTKVEAPNRYPLEITGMAVFQAFYNTRGANGLDVPTTAAVTPGRASAGASPRQSVIGLRYHGPQTVFGGKGSCSMYMDFWDGNTEGGAPPFRVRTAEVTVDWATRSLALGMMKPLISPHDPSSFAYIGISPLTSSGNLWRWQPQLRFEQRAGWFKGQAAFMQTSEDSTGAPANLLNARRRPGLELRGSANHSFDDTRRVEVASAGISRSRASAARRCRRASPASTGSSRPYRN